MECPWDLLPNQAEFNVIFISCSAVLSIGFAQAEYIFNELAFNILIRSVTIITNRPSEQTFEVKISVGPSSGDRRPAQLISSTDNHTDFSLIGEADQNEVTLVLRPSRQSVIFPFILFGDDLVEGEEWFRANISVGDDGPLFQPGPIQSTHIRILDFVGELIWCAKQECDCMYSIPANYVYIC